MGHIDGDFDYGFANTAEDVLEPFQFESLSRGSQRVRRPITASPSSDSEGSAEVASVPNSGFNVVNFLFPFICLRP
eukprot:gene4302-4871_t